MSEPMDPNTQFGLKAKAKALNCPQVLANGPPTGLDKQIMRHRRLRARAC